MTRVPTAQDFATLAPDIHVALHYPDPPASTTSILLLLHGLGDSEAPFVSFARSMNLPGVLAVAIRGTSIVPSIMVDEIGDGGGPSHFHWGDDLRLDHVTGEVDGDPNFDRALRLVASRLISDTLVSSCGWRADDILLFGFGQGGTLALALAAEVAKMAGPPLKGIITIGADIPSSISMGASSLSLSFSSSSPLLICGADGSNAVSAETEELLLLHKCFFSTVEAVRWTGRSADDNGMPRNRAEMVPIMKFLLPKLSQW